MMTASEETSNGACGPAQEGTEAGNGQLSFGEAGCFFL